MTEPRTIYTAGGGVSGDELQRQLGRLRDDLSAVIHHSERLRGDATSRAIAAEMERDRLRAECDRLLAAAYERNAEPPHDEMERLILWLLDTDCRLSSGVLECSGSPAHIAALRFAASRGRARITRDDGRITQGEWLGPPPEEVGA